MVVQQCYFSGAIDDGAGFGVVLTAVGVDVPPQQFLLSWAIGARRTRP